MKIYNAFKAILLFALACLSSTAGAVSTDLFNSPLTGMWWNAKEPGWGLSLSHQQGIMFATIQTYDAKGNPVWYVAPRCVVAGESCSGVLYQTSGGATLTAAANQPTVTAVGTIGLTFADNSNGMLNYTIDGVNGSKAITKQVFVTPAALDPKAAPCSASNFTRDTYNKIIVGMNLAQVSSIIGCANDGSLTVNVAGWITYQWTVPGQASPSIAVFVDDFASQAVPLPIFAPVLFKTGRGF